MAHFRSRYLVENIKKCMKNFLLSPILTVSLLFSILTPRQSHAAFGTLLKTPIAGLGIFCAIVADQEWRYAQRYFGNPDGSATSTQEAQPN
jgi:hypothetical protein